jgi:phosphate transport system protein
MCQVASDAMRDATSSLLHCDLSLAEQVMSRDVRIDEMRANAEEVALELLALQAPVASDLRVVVSALWIVADLQRMGALAIHVAKAARRRHPNAVLPSEMRPVFDRMGRVAVHLANQAERVLLERDVELARSLESDDDLMDDLHREMFSMLNDPDWSHGAGMAVDIALLGRFYERFADHAVAIARRVIFLVTGENVGGDTTPTAFEPVDG